MKYVFSRRCFVASSTAAAAALASSNQVFSAATHGRDPLPEETSPVRLGVASYTFRNFSRAPMIGFLKQLRVFALNAKDVKDHLPSSEQEEAAALEDYAAAGIKLHAAGAIYFKKDDQADIRNKF